MKANCNKEKKHTIYASHSDLPTNNEGCQKYIFLVAYFYNLLVDVPTLPD